MRFNSTPQTFQSRNKSDIGNLDQIVEEDGIHYNMQSLLKYPQTRAKIQTIQNTENVGLFALAVRPLVPKNKFKQEAQTENSISALKQHIEKLDKKISKYERDLKFIHRQHLEASLELSEE
jgi:hypothetical protein